MTTNTYLCIYGDPETGVYQPGTVIYQTAGDDAAAQAAVDRTRDGKALLHHYRYVGEPADLPAEIDGFFFDGFFNNNARLFVPVGQPAPALQAYVAFYGDPAQQPLVPTHTRVRRYTDDAMARANTPPRVDGQPLVAWFCYTGAAAEVPEDNALEFIQVRMDLLRSVSLE